MCIKIPKVTMHTYYRCCRIYDTIVQTVIQCAMVSTSLPVSVLYSSSIMHYKYIILQCLCGAIAVYIQYMHESHACVVLHYRSFYRLPLTEPLSLELSKWEGAHLKGHSDDHDGKGYVLNIISVILCIRWTALFDILIHYTDE